MEIYNGTGKTKTGEIRVTRPIGALVVGMSQPFAALSNETITAYVERANGNNTEILTDIPLFAFIGASTAGNPAVFETETDLQALCEICEDGSIDLQETESIKIKLDNLKSAVNYSLFGVEYPQTSNTSVKISRKNILQGETDRRFDVEGQELMLLDGVDTILELTASYVNGYSCKYIPEELKALSRDFDAVKLVRTGVAPQTDFDLPNLITFPLVGVRSIDVKKKDGEKLTIYLKNDSENLK